MDDMHPSMRRLYDLLTARGDIKHERRQSETARLLNTSSQVIKNWEVRGISKAGLLKIQDLLRINALWVADGVGLPGKHAAEVRDAASPTYELAGANARPSGSNDETPAGYVRFQLMDGAAGMGAGVVNEDYPEVLRQVDVAEWEVRRKIGYLPEPGRIALITGRGPSMRPEIDHGDVVMVDTAIQQFDGDGVYVINLGGETQIKMLQMRGDGLYVVSANPAYPPYRVEQTEDLHIGGRVVSVLGIRQV